MRLICYKAMCGDAFHLQYEGESGKHRNIFLDMGHSKTYTRVLQDVIWDIVRTSEQIDALFLSHIHEDHIGGAKSLIKDLQSDSTLENVVGRWVYNAPRRYSVNQTFNNKNGVLCGIVSGDKIYEHIMSRNPSDLKDVIEGQAYEIDGMKVIILSPNIDKLNQLRDKYFNNRPLCIHETDDISIKASNVKNDYSIPLKKFNLDHFQEDTSVENASSIAAIFELSDKRILWLSDSIPSVIMNSLSKLGYSETNKIHCDAVLVSHHGSSCNSSMELLKMISTHKYIISVDGINRHCLPDKKTVARIVSASSNLPVMLYFNYDDGRIAKMFTVDEPENLRTMIDVYYLKDREAIEI